MPRSTGPVLLAGALAAGNEAVLGPAAAHRPVNWGAIWRLVPATAGLGLGLALVERAAPQFAVGLAWLVVAGVFLFPPAGGPSVLANANTILGTSKGGG